MNKNYTTDVLVQNYLNEDVIDDVINDYILATQRHVEEYTGRVFKADTEATARLFNGNGSQALRIDDCVEISLVEVGLNYWGDSFETIPSSGANSYITLPTNHESYGFPIDKIGLRARTFTEGVANHRITAKWGYSATVPKDIEYACTVIASGMYNENRGGNTGAIKSERIGEYQVSYADQSKVNDLKRAIGILDSYKVINL